MTVDAAFVRGASYNVIRVLVIVSVLVAWHMLIGLTKTWHRSVAILLAFIAGHLAALAARRVIESRARRADDDGSN